MKHKSINKSLWPGGGIFLCSECCKWLDIKDINKECEVTMNAKELLEKARKHIQHYYHGQSPGCSCHACAGDRAIEEALVALAEQPCEKKNCKDCAFWGEGNTIKYENEGKIYKWCGYPKMGSFYNNGIAEIETTREDFGCIFFKEQGQQPCQKCSGSGEVRKDIGENLSDYIGSKIPCSCQPKPVLEQLANKVTDYNKARAKPTPSGEFGIEEADVVVDLSGGRLYIQKLKDRIEQLEEDKENLISGHFCPMPQLAKSATICNCAHSDKHREIDWATIDRLIIANTAKDKRIAELEEMVEEIEAVSCGEKQVADDDSEGMGWIYKRIQALKEKGTDAEENKNT